MRKQTKLIAVLSATALLAIGAAMTSFAATGWQEEGDTWVFYDSDENVVTDEWRKSNGLWYYLGEDGYMVTDEIVGDYYVDEDGKMVTNQWMKLQDEDITEPAEDESDWFYFGSNGKKVVDAWKKINGQWYLFGSEGRMKFDWQQQTLKDDAEGTFYLGDENDGAMKTGWQYLPEKQDSISEPTDGESWYYFGSNGKVVTSQEKKINGKWYLFDENGEMQSGWAQASNSNASSSNSYLAGWKYYGSSDDGSRVTGWIKTTGKKNFLNTADHSKDDQYWFYLKNGEAYASCMVNINNKTYAFDTDGVMLTGLVEVNNDEIFYFGKEDDGAMKTGKQNVYVEEDDETYVCYYATKAKYDTAGNMILSKGAGVSGDEKGYLYEKGFRVEAIDGWKYQPREVTADDGSTHTYLVNESGKIMKASKNNTKVYEGEYGKYTVNENGHVVSPN